MSYTDILMQAQRNLAPSDNGKSHRNGSHQKSGKQVNQAAVQRLLKEKQEKKRQQELEERRKRKEALEKREKQKKPSGRPVNNGHHDRSSGGGKHRGREEGVRLTEEQDRKHKEFMKNISKSSSGQHRSSHHSHQDSRPQKSTNHPDVDTRYREDVERKKKKKMLQQQSKPVSSISSFDQLLKLAEKQKDLSDEDSEPSPDRNSSKHGGTKRKATSSGIPGSSNGSGVFSSSFKIAKIRRNDDDNNHSTANDEEMKRKKARALAARFNTSNKSSPSSSSAGRHSTMMSSKSSSRFSNGKSSLMSKNGGRPSSMNHRNGDRPSMNHRNGDRPSKPPKKPTSNISLKPIKRENVIVDICDGLVVPKSNPNKPSKDRSKKPSKPVKKTEFSLNPYKKAELEKRKLAAKGVGGGSGSTVTTATTSVRSTTQSTSTDKKQKMKSSSGQHTSTGGSSKCTLSVQSTSVRTNYPGVSSTDPNRYQQPYRVSPAYERVSKRDEYHQRAMKAAMARGRNGRHPSKKASRALDSDEDEYDPEMDDFIVDEDESAGVNISNEISKIFRYDRSRYDTAQEEYECSRMDAGFHEIEREEQRSTRIARREDAEAAKEEERQRRLEIERKKKKKRL